MKTSFKLVKINDVRTLQPIDTLVKVSENEAGEVISQEEWTNVNDLDLLFETCCHRWGNGNWNLEKVLEAIRRSEID